MGTQHEAEQRTNEDAMRRAEQRALAQRSPFDVAFLSNAEDVTEIIFVRHGQQTWRQNLPAGELVDPPLSEKGLNQARLVGMALSTERIDAVYASPLQRALVTGQEVARHHRLDPVVVQELREVEVFRDVEPNATPADTIGQLAIMGTRHRMIYEKSWDVYPLSESSADFRNRVINVVEGIIMAHPNERVVVACHGGVINAYVGHIIGSRYDMFFRPAHASINIVAAGDGIRALYRLNDTHHLRNDEGDFHSY